MTRPEPPEPDSLLRSAAHYSRNSISPVAGPLSLAAEIRRGLSTFALVNEAEQDVLSADVVVVEHPGLVLSQDNNLPRPVGKSLKHPPLRLSARCR
jgi:hypothetical protein